MQGSSLYWLPLWVQTASRLDQCCRLRWALLQPALVLQKAWGACACNGTGTVAVLRSLARRLKSCSASAAPVTGSEAAGWGQR